MYKMGFEERKKKGNGTEIYFQQCYSDWERTSPFQENDFITTTSDIPDEIKYLPDYRSGECWCEVKDSCFWNKDEFEYQVTHFDNLYVFSWSGLHNILEFEILGPYEGTTNGSGLPYYKFQLRKSWNGALVKE